MISEIFTTTSDNIPLRMSEDCLYLNIYTPANLMKKTRLPVSRVFQHCATCGCRLIKGEDSLGWRRHSHSCLRGPEFPLPTTARPCNHRKHKRP